MSTRLFAEAQSWMPLAECRNHPEVNFFPKAGESLEPARALCRVCPVSTQCDDYATATAGLPGMHGHVDGVWAGKSGKQRQKDWSR